MKNSCTASLLKQHWSEFKKTKGDVELGRTSLMPVCVVRSIDAFLRNIFFFLFLRSFNCN